MLMTLINPYTFVFADDSEAAGTPSVPVVVESANSDALSSLLRQAGKKYSDSDTISFIVQINDEVMAQKHGLSVPNIEAIRTTEGLREQLEYAELSQSIVQNILDAKAFSYELEEHFDTALNGLALTTSFREAKLIASLDEVKAIELDRFIPAPELKEFESYDTKDVHSNTMIKANEAWKKEYSGKSSFIAIIDSGADPDHEVFKLNGDFDLGAGALERDDIEALIASSGINRGSFINKKIPFGYNYAHKNNNIKERSEDSHGMHVAGIVAANSEKLKGVAPHAQLAIMRVYGGGPLGEGTRSVFYNKAIDDAVKLGVDSINISFGSPGTTDSKLEDATRAALERASKAGIVIAISAGNDGFMGYRYLDGPHASNPNYGLINAPSVAEVSMSVASVDNSHVEQKAILLQDTDGEILEDKILYMASDDKEISEEFVSFVHVGLGYDEDYYIKNKAGEILTEKIKGNEESKKIQLEVKVEEEHFTKQNQDENQSDAFTADKEEIEKSVAQEEADRGAAQSKDELSIAGMEDSESALADEKTELDSAFVKEGLEAPEESVAEESKALTGNEQARKKDLNGKYALIKRGKREGDNFSLRDKIFKAQQEGALAAIVYDNTDSKTLIKMNLKGANEIKIPSFFISKKDGEALLENPGLKLKFSKQNHLLANPTSYDLSKYSSWGMTEEGNLKPDIAAPGGKIFSSINNNKYMVMSGTSMATPHVTGGIAVVKEYVEKTFPAVSGAEKHSLVKNLLMSTATPHKFTDSPDAVDYGSPRGQGAGLMNLERALNSEVVVLGPRGISSINLGDITTDTVTVKGTLKNYGTESKHFSYYGVLCTDKVELGHITLKPRVLVDGRKSKKSITVEAGGTADFELRFELSSSLLESLHKEMPNGYFLEGYVFFESPGGEQNINAPFVGFKGVWDQLDVIEPSIYDLVKKDARPYYYKFANKVKYPFTYLSSEVDGRLIALGEAFDSSYENPKFEKEHIAFSPNRDTRADAVTFNATFFRNFKDFELRIFSKQDVEKKSPLYEVEGENGEGNVKNFYSDFTGANMNQSDIDWEWDGKDKKDKTAPEGEYVMEIKVKPEGKSEYIQTMELPIILDVTEPSIVRCSYNSGTRTFILDEYLEEGSGIKDLYVEYQEKNENKAPVKQKIRPASADRKEFILPENVELKDAKVVLLDHANNILRVSLDQLEKKPLISLIPEPVIEDSAFPFDKFKYEVQDLKGNKIQDHKNLEPGEYTVIISDIDEGYRLSQSDNRFKVVIKESDTNVRLKIRFERKEKPQQPQTPEQPQQPQTPGNQDQNSGNSGGGSGSGSG
ncbi:MAG: S8 family serine peptidase, partial [Bacillota bacterium]|nr:S8 family serine peptidase [Bacillota bacterium]